MCTMITATVNDTANLDDLNASLTRRVQAFLVVDNPVIGPLLPPKRVYLVHSAYCDCGTALGKGRIGHEAPFSEADVAKLRAKGWSEGRIRRWKEEKLRVSERPGRSMTSEDWLEVVRDALQVPSVEVFGLMHHFYDCNLDVADFYVYTSPPVPVREATPQMLADLQADTLLEFRV